MAFQLALVINGARLDNNAPPPRQPAKRHLQIMIALLAAAAAAGDLARLGDAGNTAPTATVSKVQARP